MEILEIHSARRGGRGSDRGEHGAAGGADRSDIKVSVSSIIMSMQKLGANGNNSTRYEESCGTFYTGNDDRSWLCLSARLSLVHLYKH